MMVKFISFFFSLFLFTSTAFATEYQGKVVSVMDGDTVKVLAAGKQIKVRLAQIDAPEKSQAYGMKSKESLAGMIAGELVRVVQEDKDRYGRIVGRIYKGNLDVNAEQVKRGMAWVYVKYATEKSYFTYEKEARKNKLGLWKDSNPTPPWEYRHPKKKPSTNEAVSSSPRCGQKRYCKEMTSCAEAKFYLNNCGVRSLDGDRDGVPCEALCR